MRELISLTGRQHLVLDYVRANPGCTTGEVRRGCRLSPPNAARFTLGQLYAERLLERRKSYRSMEPATWTVSA